MISQRDVVVFKAFYCDENLLIVELLKDRLGKYFLEPVLDVGAGTGDIVAAAFPERRVVHLDILDYSHHPIPRTHRRERVDFFNYDWERNSPLGTLLFCHVLQFLDEDIDRLNARVETLNPQRIATILNANDFLMGELVSWSLEHLPGCNPEVQISDFPTAYILEDEVSFTATVSASDYQTLAQQVCYLMDFLPNDVQLSLLVEFLSSKLTHPSFPINQTVRIYKRP